MALPLYLAMTAAEIRKNEVLPSNPAYMACHFSPYGTGLSNLPPTLPEGALLILNDRTPICGHDPERIAAQLETIIHSSGASGLLLDFQRPGEAETARLATHLASSLPCPVGVSETYAASLSCPVFLPPAPLDIPLEDYLRPWEGREIWLELALDGMIFTLTESGCITAPLPPGAHPKGGHRDEHLCCHYQIELSETAQFTLYRTRDDLDLLLNRAETLGVTSAVGLWQELHAHHLVGEGLDPPAI